MRREVIIKIRRAILIFSLAFCANSIIAQVPDAINFQAIARDEFGDILVETPIMIQLSILDGSPTGTEVYREVRSVTTNTYGSFAFQIGRDPYMHEGDFSAIEWAGGDKYLKVDYDPTATLTFDLTLGTIEFVSVPFAFASKSVTYIDTTGVQNGDVLIYNELSDRFEPGQVNSGSNDLDDLLVLLENNGLTVVDFSVSETEININTEITFTDLSLIDANTWQWDFGDGNTSTDQNPTHTYTAEGTYTVSLTASNGTLSSTETKSDYITVNDGPTYGTFNDSRDGTEYQTITIGSQEWMAENLKYLPSVVGPGTGSETTAYYYVHGYDGTNVTDAKATSNYATYGVLYNWSAAMEGAESSSSNPSGVQGICPTGWHLPSDAEWIELTDFLGGESVAGGKLKEAGLENWISPNEAATNETGFSALPGSRSLNNGTFDNSIGYFGFWWSSTEYNSSNSWSRGMTYHLSSVSISYDYTKEMGFSIRCVRD